MKNTQKVALGLAGLAGIAMLTKLRHTKADLSGQTALVTGSSHGLGFLLAREIPACRMQYCDLCAW